MPKKSLNQKAKLLHLYEILTQNSDENHPMTSEELCGRLVALGISCDKRTLRRDMHALNEQGYEVMNRMIGHKKAYYVEDRNFSVPELKILIDAVQAASFITEKKSKELIEKIAYLGGSVRAEILKNNIVSFNTHKHTNESIYYNVGTLEEALLAKKKASFFYFDMNENGERVYRKDKWRYTVSPLALIFVDDNYYLMTYHSKKGSIVNYRVDRMEQVNVEADLICSTKVTRMTKPDDIPHEDSRIALERPAQMFVQAWNLIISKWQQYEPRLKKIADKDGNLLTRYHASEMLRLMGEIGKLNDFDYSLSLKVLDHMELQLEGKLTVIFLSGIRVTI